MKLTMVIPSYWGRKKSEGWKEGDVVYDHPTALDEEGTLRRLLKSLSILQNKDFNLMIIAVPTTPDIEEKVELKISSIVKENPTEIETHLFSSSHLKKVHHYLADQNHGQFSPLLQLNGYSNVRNLCLFLPHILSAEAAVLIDDDEVFEDPLFMEKAAMFIGQDIDKEKILGVAGYYLNPDNDFLLKKDIFPWMTYWNKNDCMNRAFMEIIAKGPRLKESPFAFGGNMVVHRNLFKLIPFDPAITRGEDIDFLINARMFGYKIYLDNELSIKHLAPPKSHPIWRQMREDIYRFVFEKSKLEAQKPTTDMAMVKAEDLDPYPGEFLKDDLEEKIFRSNQMLAVDYLRKDDKTGAEECMKNIYLAQTDALLKEDPFENLLKFQKMWKSLMDYSEKRAEELCRKIEFSG